MGCFISFISVTSVISVINVTSGGFVVFEVKKIRTRSKQGFHVIYYILSICSGTGILL